MALMPKRVKYRKVQKGRVRGRAGRGNTVAFGEFGLQALARARISGRQIEAGRVSATHHLQRLGQVYIRIFPDKPVSKKPLEVRMGKGKGEPDHWVACVKPGTILFEIGGVGEDIAKEALSRVAHKMPLATRMVRRRHTL